MDISELNKCILNGRKNLTNALQIAYKLKYKYITLIDASNIRYNHSETDYNCSISLKMYNILLKGKSWYNKYGLYSDTHDFEQEEIKRIRNTMFYMVIWEFSGYDNYVYNSYMRLIDYFQISIYKSTKNYFKELEKN